MRKAILAIMGILLLSAADAIGWFSVRRPRRPSEPRTGARKPVMPLTPASSLLLPDYHSGTLSRDAPQPVYAPDADDPWNPIFYCLFTRTVRTRLSQEFQEAGPFTPVQAMGFPGLPVSQRAQWATAARGSAEALGQ